MFQQFLYHHHLCLPPSALLFPAVNPRRRYLIHNTVQENFPQLTTISVGQGDQRRTAVTFKKNCNKQGGRNEDDKKDSCPDDKVSEETSAVSKQQVQHKSSRHQQQQQSRSQGQSQSLPPSQPKQQSQQQQQQQSQSQPQIEKTTNSSGRIAKENRRPEQLLYSPQKQGSLLRIDLKKEAQQQSGKQEQQQSHSKQGTPQQQQQQHSHSNQGTLQQQQQQKELVVVQSQHNRTQQHSAQQQKQQKSPEGPEISPKSNPPEEIPRGQRDNRTDKRYSELAGKAEQKAELEAEHDPRCIRERSSSSCNSETGSSSVQSTLETPNDRLKNDDPMRDSGAEENQNSSCNNSRKRRNRRNRKQKDGKTGEGGTGGEYHNQQQHYNDHGHVNGKQEDFNKGGKTRQSESLHNLSGGFGGGGSGVIKSTSGGEICDDSTTSNISNKNNAEFNNNNNSNRAFVQKACENSSRKLHSHTTSIEASNRRSNSGTNRQQNNIRYPVSSWKEEFRESGSPSPSDYIVKESPERMPVTVPSEQGNNRRRGKAPAQIYRPPPARSSRDTNLPPQPHQQQAYYNQQQQQIHLYQPAYSQQFQPKQLFSPSHNYTPQHHPPSHPPNNYQHNYYPQQQDMHHYHSLPRRQRNDSESSTATLSGENQNNRGKGRRPDQVLYVPRGRRSVANEPGSARGTPTPLIDYESHPRPPSPAYSICSTASEFSGRNRYNKQGSRQGSQVSIYDGENDRVHGKPPLSRDFNRESTPGYGRQKVNAGGRFSSQTLQLIERCLNHETDHKYNEYSNNETDFNSSSPKNNKGGGGDGSVQKSPTPTRDIHSIHSKENVIHPIESNSRSRRSRKNRRRHSRSRDGSADQYQNVAKDGKGNGIHNEDWQSSPGERGLGSCERIFYNSNFNSSQDRYDRGYDNYDRYSSINSSRASSRNSSRERTPQRNINHNWRGGSNPPSPSKGPIMFYQTRHSPGKPPSGRLGSLPNVALDCGESPKRLSNHKEENQRFNTLPGKNKSPIINDLHTQTAEKNNIEYGSGCIVSDRIDINPCMDTSQNTSLASDLMHQNQSSETRDNHNEEFIKSNINLSNSSMHTEPVSGVINQLQECNLDRENKIYLHDSSLKEVKNIKNNSVNGTANIEEESSAVFDENLKNESTSEVNDISSEETLNKPTDFISETPLEEVYSNTEAELSMTESTKDSMEEVSSSDNDTKDNLSETKEGNIDEDDKKKNPKKFQFNWADEVEDSWDNLYDDDGECLDPEIKRQLSDSLGKIKLEKPANDYYSFQPREPEINEEEYGHVIEIYDFPVSFKTQDLMMVFSSFQNTGFDIKWVDDTHALGIFATALIAAEALSVDHPFLKTRSLSLATKSSKAKAMRIAEALLPYKPRPATSASLARRLVSGALGLKVNISREVREAERQKLKDAKAQKRLAAKQRVDAWEGTLT